jgi:hypothetical protein
MPRLNFADLTDYAIKSGYTLRKGNRSFNQGYTLTYTYPPNIETNGCTHLEWLDFSSNRLIEILTAIKDGYLCRGQKNDFC